MCNDASCAPGVIRSCGPFCRRTPAKGNMRGSSRIGGAEAQISLLVQKDTYDITVDAFRLSVEECADKIIELIDNPENFEAFKLLKMHIE
jgi:hypothetical protein